MSPDRDIREEVEREMNRTTPNWGLVRMLLEEITQQRKQAESVARRLLGQPTSWRECEYCFGWGKRRGSTCPHCNGRGKFDVY